MKVKRRTKAEMLYLKSTVIEITDNLSDYWPMTLRQIYYQLVAKEVIANNNSEYKQLSTLLTKMRVGGELSWGVMEDRTRRTVKKQRWTDSADFIKEQLSHFLNGYQRCLVQQQENYVELWVEKDALSRIFEQVALPYCVTIVTCKGQVSTTFINDYAKRAENAIDKGQRPVIIYGGDLDPTGWRIPISIEKRLHNQHLIPVLVDRFALTIEQIYNYDLIHNPDALKWDDPNAKKFVDIYGQIAVELDALHPQDLENEIRRALAKYLDIESMGEEINIQKQEQLELKQFRQAAITAMEEQGIAL